MEGSAPTSEAPTHATGELWFRDFSAGFFVFLLALPLSLGIALASGFPPMAGLLTAIVGGLVASFLGSAPLTIKGPAAGLIVIVLGAVQELGEGDVRVGYRRALATIVVAGVIQIVFARVRAGKLGDFFPSSVVHGMLAAIGVIVFSKQSYVLLGVRAPRAGTLGLLAGLPASIPSANPEIAFIGLLSLLLLVALPLLPWNALKKVPGPLVVVVLSIGLSAFFNLGHEHHYRFQSHDFSVGPNYLVQLHGSLFRSLTFPDFSVVFSAKSLEYVVMFALIGSLESLLSAKAIEGFDPLQRRSSLDNDLFAVGVGNVIAGLLGGLPMISEVVRSTANVGYGARTQKANFFHGVFLLGSVLIAPWLLERIPLAALAGMLVYIGARLASPLEFARTYRIGKEQLLLFCTTLLVTLATDLLVGVFVGILLKVALHWWAGMSLRNLFKPQLTVEEKEDRLIVHVGQAAVFSNYLAIKQRLDSLAEKKLVEVELSKTTLVDHTVMEKLTHLTHEWKRDGKVLLLTGLEAHRPYSPHPFAARVRAVPA